jgi:hypothetical protein
VRVQKTDTEILDFVQNDEFMGGRFYAALGMTKARAGLGRRDEAY